MVSSARAEDFSCHGDDPGWELGSSGSGAVLRSAGGGRRTFTGSATSLTAEGVVVWRGRSSEEAGDLVVVMIEGVCSGTKDAPGSHAAVASHGVWGVKTLSRAW
jgi:hypothetical protein